MPKVPAADTRFRLTDDQAVDLADRFGTPLYVLSEAHIRDRAKRYRDALAASWPRTELSFASKSNSTLAVLALLNQCGCGIDVASEGELQAAIRAGVDPARCHMHGNNKSTSELQFAVSTGIGMIVVDNFEEIDNLIAIGARTQLVLRLAPGVDPITHARIRTGQADTKFGFNIADGSAERAARRCREAGLNLVGVHCHVGSQLLDPEAQREGGAEIARFARRLAEDAGFELAYLNVGGGLGVRYTDRDEPWNIADYCRLVADAVGEALDGSSFKPILAHEPGRSLVGEAGVTLYSVGVIKDVPIEGGERRYVVVDGGLADNPRPAMYESRYTVEFVGRAGDALQETCRISGRHCETDTLFDDIALPADVRRGDLVQVLCTGAYNASMASNYNRYPRPRAVLIGLDGSVDEVQSPETWDAMFARERVPERLRRTV